MTPSPWERLACSERETDRPSDQPSETASPQDSESALPRVVLCELDTELNVPRPPLTESALPRLLAQPDVSAVPLVSAVPRVSALPRVSAQPRVSAVPQLSERGVGARPARSSGWSSASRRPTAPRPTNRCGPCCR